MDTLPLSVREKAGTRTLRVIIVMKLKRKQNSYTDLWNVQSVYSVYRAETEAKGANVQVAIALIAKESMLFETRNRINGVAAHWPW